VSCEKVRSECEGIRKRKRKRKSGIPPRASGKHSSERSEVVLSERSEELTNSELSTMIADVSRRWRCIVLAELVRDDVDDRSS